jgi:hypothetical protein
MLDLVGALAAANKLTISDARAALGLNGTSDIEDYRNFLASGGFIEGDPAQLTKAEKLDRFWTAVKLRDLAAIYSLLMDVPSFVKFMDYVRSRNTDKAADFATPSRSLVTYTALAEISGAALAIPDEGLYATPNNPKPNLYAAAALEEYVKLSSGPDDWVLTGAWLEALARGRGIHPLVARDRLEEARAAGLIERYAEGSTPDTRFSKHVLHVLDLQNAKPALHTVGLYEGGFLIPGRGSVMLRLKGGQQ